MGIKLDIDNNTKVVALLSGFARELSEGKDFEETIYKTADRIESVFDSEPILDLDLDNPIEENWEAVEETERLGKEKTGDPETGFNASMFWLGGHRHLLIPLEYRKPTKNGFTKKRFEMNVYAKYCPFTGKPLYRKHKFSSEDREHFTKAGEFFGYPKCCIQSFVYKQTTDEQEKASRNLGFLPCEKHAKSILSGDIALEDLIENRVCSSPFPKECSDEEFLKYMTDEVS